MYQTVKQRIIMFIEYKNISVREFERTCGLSYGYVNNMRVYIQPDKLANIAVCFPDLNTGLMISRIGKERLINYWGLSLSAASIVGNIQGV